MYNSLHQIADRTSLIGDLQTLKGDSLNAVLLINIQKFRSLNAAYGHPVGDQVLLELAQQLQPMLREGDGVYRLGNDEFALLITRLANPQRLILATNRIKQKVENGFQVGLHRIRIRLRMAAACQHGGNRDYIQLLQDADAAMHHAIKLGESFVLFDPKKHQADTAPMALESELETALEQSELELYFQPKIHLPSGRIHGAEALCRWNSSQRGLIYPDAFIPVLEQSDLVIPFTEWCLNAALRQCTDCNRQFGCLTVAVNLSARILHYPELQDMILRALQIWGTRPGNLILEVTESAMMLDPESSMAALRALHDAGVRISIDDFGTGYSSLSYLKSLPVRELKIDKSFVMEMDNSLDDEKIVRSIIDLAHNFDLWVVAEGIENQSILERLRTLGCDLGQGYHIGRPMQKMAMKEWMVDSPWSLGSDTASQPSATEPDSESVVLAPVGKLL